MTNRELCWAVVVTPPGSLGEYPRIMMPVTNRPRLGALTADTR